MLSDRDSSNFEFLIDSIRKGTVALMEVQRKRDGKEVAVICTVDETPDGYQFVPFAVMVEGSPFDLFAPSNEDGTGYVYQEAL